MLRPCALAALVLGLAGSTCAQVRVLLPASQFKTFEQIRASVRNDTSRPITLCVQIGQTSPTGASTESTPIPFFIQVKSKIGWSTLMIGPDVGSARFPTVLDAGKSAAFPFRLNQYGQLRVVLNYWSGSRPDLDCSKTPRRKKAVRSSPFVMPMIEN